MVLRGQHPAVVDAVALDGRPLRPAIVARPEQEADAGVVVRDVVVAEHHVVAVHARARQVRRVAPVEVERLDRDEVRRVGDPQATLQRGPLTRVAADRHRRPCAASLCHLHVLLVEAGPQATGLTRRERVRQLLRGPVRARGRPGRRVRPGRRRDPVARHRRWAAGGQSGNRDGRDRPRCGGHATAC